MVYFGFSLGLLNTYLFTREGGFTKEEYGLTGIFIAISALMYAFANLGTPAYVVKFFPYYNANLKKKDNDLFTWSLVVSMIGFCLVVISGIYFKDHIIRKFGQNSPDLVKYYYWIFPFGLGLTLYSILENYAIQLKNSVLVTFLREVQFRLFSTVLIVLTLAGILAKFDMFIKVYSFTYLGIAFILLGYLFMKDDLHFTFTISNVSRKFFKKILTLMSFVFGGSLLVTISTVFDSILIASVLGLKQLAIFTLAQNIASLVQAPQRGIITSSIAALSEAWRKKDLPRIARIYRQSSINQLIFSVGLFSLIWLNFVDAVDAFHMQKGYVAAQWAFFFIGLYRILDMGTGVSSQIIATSTRWRFEFFTGIILIFLTLPLNYILTKYYFGLVGPAIANLISFTIYNSIRYWFLKTKFNLQPFTKETLYTILLGIFAFYVCHFLLGNIHGFAGLFARSICFILLYATGALTLKLSSDVLPVWNTFVKKTGIKKGA
jgi:O-antigen/teichoic acid export membrane protein